jgi:LysR family hydrogen peroxide-inducible transcriptional activator
MEIHQLQYFVAIVETGGFSRAAQRCNVAQPSLSQQIIKLEQELGQQLFERLGRTVLLTSTLSDEPYRAV